jgi:hypothetical protein
MVCLLGFEGGTKHAIDREAARSDFRSTLSIAELFANYAAHGAHAFRQAIAILNS